MKPKLVLLVGFVCGKTYAINLLKTLKERGKISNCEFLHELDEKYGGAAVKEAAKNSPPKIQAEIYWQNRFDLLDSIICPMLDSGKDVICEHGFPTTWAWQMEMMGLKKDPDQMRMFEGNVRKFLSRVNAEVCTVVLDRRLNDAFENGVDVKTAKKAFLDSPNYFRSRFPEIKFYKFSQDDYSSANQAPALAAYHIATQILGHDISSF
jgi:thymidylate kinase